MVDFLKHTEPYIQKQERFYNRPLANFNKFLIREFASYLQKATERENVKIEITKATTEQQPPLHKVLSSKPTGKIKVALITEDVGHLTGGRYYCWFIASALVELGYEVVVYTNQKPVFGGEFINYKQPQIKIVARRAKELASMDCHADIYIGSPISGNIAAARLGKKYQKPAFALIFDPFPMMSKYLGNKVYAGWQPLIAALRATDINIISLCNATAEYIYDWLNKREDQVFSIYPCINSRELNDEQAECEDYVVYVSRLVKHKNFDHVVKICRNLGLRLKVIASVDGINADTIVKDLHMGKSVDFCINVSDKEKFQIIRKSRAVISASIFEGFGMWFIEAISCGVPTVCYDYPTIHEIQKYAKATNVYMAEWNNMKSLEEQLARAIEEKKFSEPSKIFYFEEMVKRVREVFTIEPRMGVITIALNEQKFIGASLRSVIRHPNIKKVAVVEGAVNLFKHAAGKDGLSVDKTSGEVFRTMKEEGGGKIIYERYGWAVDKSELRNRALMLLGKDITHVLVVDADEVYRQEDLDNLVRAMRDNPMTGVFLFPFYHFWKRKDLIATGGQWDSQMFRCFRYGDKTLHWKHHVTPVVNQYDEFINVIEGSINLDNVHVYHYSYLKDEKNIVDKLEYYRKRDGHILNVKNTWSGWKPGDPTQPTHGNGIAVSFSGEHPPEVRGRL